MNKRLTATDKIPHFLRRHYPVVIYVSAFLLSRVVGMRMQIPFEYFQLQSREWLQYDLFRSIFFLHAQPPLMNLWLGFGLKLAWLMGTQVESLMLLFHFAIGLFAAHCIGAFTREFIRNTRLSFACNLVLLLHPVVYASMHQYFYTFHEWVLLAALAWAIRRYSATPKAGGLALIAALLLLMVYTRSLFHFLWAFVALLPLAWHGSRAIPSARRGLAIVCVAFTLMVFAWPLKNRIVFGFFGYSSWQGANLAQGIAMKDFPIAVDADLPPLLGDVPCLREKLNLIERLPTEDIVAFNYNHFSLMETSRKLQELTLDMIRQEPALLWRKLRQNYWTFTRFTGRQSHYAHFGMAGKLPTRTANAWMKIYEVALNQDFRNQEQLKAHAYRLNPDDRKFDVWLPSLMWLTLPFVMMLALIRLLRNRRAFTPNDAAVLLFVFTILWVLAMVLLIDGREGNRMRFSTETYFIWLVFWLMDGFLARNKIETIGDTAS